MYLFSFLQKAVTSKAFKYLIIIYYAYDWKFFVLNPDSADSRSMGNRSSRRLPQNPCHWNRLKSNATPRRSRKLRIHHWRSNRNSRRLWWRIFWSRSFTVPNQLTSGPSNSPHISFPLAFQTNSIPSNIVLLHVGAHFYRALFHQIYIFQKCLPFAPFSPAVLSAETEFRFIQSGVKEEEWSRYLREVYRILKPGGYAQICEPDIVPISDTNSLPYDAPPAKVSIHLLSLLPVRFIPPPSFFCLVFNFQILEPTSHFPPPVSCFRSPCSFISSHPFPSIPITLIFLPQFSSFLYVLPLSS